MRKAYLIILLVSCVLLCGIIAVARDARQLQAKLDELYWVRDNTHSGMVGIFIDIAESKLQQKTTILMTLIASFVIFVVAGVYATSKRLPRVPTIGGTLLLFLLLLILVAYAFMYIGVNISWLAFLPTCGLAILLAILYWEKREYTLERVTA